LEKIVSTPEKIGRRGFLLRTAGGLAALSLGGCDDSLSQNPTVVNILESAEKLTRVTQKTITGPYALAPEYSEAEISQDFKANGTTDPEDDHYKALAKNNFADYRLKVHGLVETPMEFSLAELRAMPSRTQITRHDCVEGWSCIGKWKGVQLSRILNIVKPKSEARYVMFYSADAMDEDNDPNSLYYESIDMQSAHHPQTILAYDMNDAALSVPHGAPLRLRDERQLGYKMAKYVMEIELVEGFGNIRGGNGGYWEDQGYEWYAGI
jgi:DMSO/TMAO reductase YedYZ molybdopterin-dependent catalytic subunit